MRLISTACCRTIAATLPAAPSPPPPSPAWAGAGDGTGATAADFVLWNGYNDTSPAAETFIAPSSAYTGIIGTAVVNPPPLGLPQALPTSVVRGFKVDAAAKSYSTPRCCLLFRPSLNFPRYRGFARALLVPTRL